MISKFKLGNGVLLTKIENDKGVYYTFGFYNENKNWQSKFIKPEVGEILEIYAKDTKEVLKNE